MNDDSVLVQMMGQFALLSLLSIGGVNVVLPETHRYLVDVHHWISEQEFADFFAIAQAAPGPNFMMFALFGWKIAGFVGAVAATLAIAVPPATCAFVFGGWWHRLRDTPWRRAVQAGLAPITIGLIFSSGYVLSIASDHDWTTFAVTAVTAVISLATKINPLWLFLIAGLGGIVGWI